MTTCAQDGGIPATRRAKILDLAEHLLAQATAIHEHAQRLSCAASNEDAQESAVAVHDLGWSAFCMADALRSASSATVPEEEQANQEDSR